jgi:coenzyme Q-binding protein COQ10
MPHFTTRRSVRHSADDMFDLVADVEKYPQFVPLCQSLRVRRRTPAEVGIEIVVAEMTIAYKVIRETFTSKVTLDRPRLQILVQYLDGPFRKMENRWAFVATGDERCDVEFSIDYEFKSRTLGLLMGAMFDTAFRRFAAAFEARADQVYGKRTPRSA